MNTKTAISAEECQEIANKVNHRQVEKELEKGLEVIGRAASNGDFACRLAVQGFGVAEGLTMALRNKGFVVKSPGWGTEEHHEKPYTWYVWVYWSRSAVDMYKALQDDVPEWAQVLIKKYIGIS